MSEAQESWLPWKPISDAPKDRAIALWIEGIGPSVGQWDRNEFHRNHSRPYWTDEGLRRTFGVAWMRSHQPTHWCETVELAPGTVLHEAGMGPRELADKVDAGDKFKAFVHSYLDERDVPHGDPENQHQMEGCRIGARLDLLFDSMFADKRALSELSTQRAEALKELLIHHNYTCSSVGPSSS